MRQSNLYDREQFCISCDGDGKHEIACKHWPGGEVEVEDLARFLFCAANPSSDGPRVMQQMEDQANAILRRFVLTKR